MVQPIEMKKGYRMILSNGFVCTTIKVWQTFRAAYEGDSMKLKELIAVDSDLAYAHYNYTPLIHFAVRQGYTDMTRYLLSLGAYDPEYRTYPFLDSLETIASDRGHPEILHLLQDYGATPNLSQFKNDNALIDYNRTEQESLFEKAVNDEKIDDIKRMLNKHTELARNETFFWGEGILMMPAKEGNIEVLELLMHYGARVPKITKWCRYYYFKHYETAAFLMQKGMDSNHMSWQQVYLLHDMAHEGDIRKAELLLRHGASVNVIDQEYESTPLGFAVRWGNSDMVDFLLENGADANLAGAAWSTPLSWALRKDDAAIREKLIKAGAK